MTIKAVLFDLDGTLADTIPLTVYSIKETVRQLSGREYSDEEILDEFGPVESVIIQKLLPEEFDSKGFDIYVQCFMDHFEGKIIRIDGIPELLNHIKSRGISTALFTGRGSQVTQIILEKLNLCNCFDYLLTGDDISRPKPDPEGILKVLSDLKIHPSESLYVGDTDADIKASKAAGALSVLALWASTSSEKLLELEPGQYFRTPYEFIQWLDTQK